MSKTKQAKQTEAARMGHTKVSDKRQHPCTVCGEPAPFIQLNYSIQKPNGATGQRSLKAYLHVACTSKL